MESLDTTAIYPPVEAASIFLPERLSLSVVSINHPRFSANIFHISSSSPANQFKINLIFTGSRLPLYAYGALQIKLINHDGINETFTLIGGEERECRRLEEVAAKERRDRTAQELRTEIVVI